MAAMLLHTRSRLTCPSVSSSLLHHLNDSRLKPTQPLSRRATLNQSRSMSVKEHLHSSRGLDAWSVPMVYFLKNKDVPRSMFLRLTAGEDPPLVSFCNEYFLEIVLLYPWIGQPAVARHCLALLIVHGTQPDLHTFTILLKSYCKDPHLTYQHLHHLVFTQMKAVGDVEPDDSFYQTLVESVAARFGPRLGYQLLKDLRSSFPGHVLQLPLSCYDRVVRRFCRRNMIDNEAAVSELIDLLMSMKQQRIFLDDKIINYLIRGRAGGYGSESFLKAVRIGEQMFAVAIKIKATAPKKYAK